MRKGAPWGQALPLLYVLTLQKHHARMKPGRELMPEISRFYGIIIKMYWHDHNPPHFHAYYGDEAASIAMKNLKIIEGRIPGKAIMLVRE